MSVDIVVVAREVWDTRDLVGQVLDDAGGINPAVVATRFEPEDLNALEMALRLKDAQGGKVTVLSAGEPRAVDVLREALYRGADATVRVAADPLALDEQALAAAYADAIRGLGSYGLVLVGTTVVDGANSLLGAHLAAALGVDQVSWVDAIEEASAEHVVAKRAIEMGYESVDVRLPAVLSVGVALLEDDPRAPRSAKAMLKLKMKKAEIPVHTAPATEPATRTAGRAAVPARVIETRVVDAESEAALKAMMDEARKGD
jgi:electron transfer flavoprotein beta subunit